MKIAARRRVWHVTFANRFSCRRFLREQEGPGVTFISLTLGGLCPSGVKPSGRLLSHDHPATQRIQQGARGGSLLVFID